MFLPKTNTIFALSLLLATVSSMNISNFLCSEPEPMITGNETNIGLTAELLDSYVPYADGQMKISLGVHLSKEPINVDKKPFCNCQSQLLCNISHKGVNDAPTGTGMSNTFGLKHGGMAIMTFGETTMTRASEDFNVISLKSLSTSTTSEFDANTAFKLKFSNDRLQDKFNYLKFYWSDMPCTQLCDVDECNLTFNLKKSPEEENHIEVVPSLELKYKSPTGSQILLL